MLAQADVIACEDTRVTAKLLAIHGISRPLLRYDEHSRAHGWTGLDRAACAAASGWRWSPTPARRLVSDPGDRLVRDCIDAGAAGGGDTRRLGAVSPRFAYPACRPDASCSRASFRRGTTARRRELEELADIAATLVLLESPQRLAASLADMADVLGPRDAAVARELTKLFEEVRRGPLANSPSITLEAARLRAK